MKTSRMIRIYKAREEKRPFIVGNRRYGYRADGSEYFWLTALGQAANKKWVP